MYPFKGNKHLSLAQQEIMAAQKKGYLFSLILKSKILKEPLWILVSFVLRIQTILSLIRDTTV